MSCRFLRFGTASLHAPLLDTDIHRFAERVCRAGPLPGCWMQLAWEQAALFLTDQLPAGPDRGIARECAGGQADADGIRGRAAGPSCGQAGRRLFDPRNRANRGRAAGQSVTSTVAAWRRRGQPGSSRRQWPGTRAYPP